MFSDVKESKSLFTSLWLYFLSVVGLLALLFVLLITPARAQSAPQIQNFTENEVIKIIANYFQMSSESVAEVVNAVFDEKGEPNAYIKGEEASGAFGIGLRFGRGEIVTRSGERRPIYWRGPSLGIDAGGDASKTFTLIYNLNAIDDIYQRFPGVEGSAYFIAGIAVNFQKRGEITLAPMRTGVGVRAGANIGYIRFSEDEKFWKF